MTRATSARSFGIAQSPPPPAATTQALRIPHPTQLQRCRTQTLPTPPQRSRCRERNAPHRVSRQSPEQLHGFPRLANSGNPRPSTHEVARQEGEGAPPSPRAFELFCLYRQKTVHK
eukprot:gene12559-biopygen18496